VKILWPQKHSVPNGGTSLTVDKMCNRYLNGPVEEQTHKNERDKEMKAERKKRKLTIRNAQ
jgi:hypothetical protein